jgi:hypothetical protein
LRLTARPLNGLELTIERTAQWCGEGRSCTLNDFWNLFSGKDNEGENISAAEEPGNQLASWDIRWASPITSADYTVYWQHTGETIDHHIPRPYRTMDLMGIETWGDWGSGGSAWRAGFEWANTRCGGTVDEKKYWDCAYNHHIFTDGYRYYGRVIGHTIDGDGDSYSVRFIQVDNAGNTLSIVPRYSKLNQGGNVPDTHHSVAKGPENWIGLDASYRRVLGNSGWLEVGVGGDHRDRMWKGENVMVGRAWLQWNHAFR